MINRIYSMLNMANSDIRESEYDFVSIASKKSPDESQEKEHRTWNWPLAEKANLYGML